MTKEEFLTIACNHYNDQLQKLKITSEQTQEYEGNLDTYNQSIRDIRNRLTVKLKSNGICSDFLVNQLARHASSLGEMFENKNATEDFRFIEFYNALEILDIIELLEDGKLVGEPFKRIPLKGLYKIHHNSHSGRGYSLIFNIKKYWFNDENELNPKRVKEFERIIDQTGLNSISTLLNKMHNRIYSKDLTGEWIIYAVHNNIKYYLCLALHNEGDESIFKNKIKNCYNQFPELSLLG